LAETRRPADRSLGVGCAALGELIDALFPERCYLCGARADGDRWGWSCRDHALPAEPAGPRCGRCAQRLPEALPDGARCPDCRRKPPGFTRALALFDWRAQPEVRPWVFALKYGGRSDLARPLGTLLGRRLLGERGAGSAGALVTHLPLHPRRRFERGYDQAELLARHAAEAAGARFAACLRRRRATPVQGGPGAVSRSANVRGAFAPRFPRAAGRLAGREVWLVDDVLTSGASASEGARALRRLGAASVGVLVLVRAGEGPAGDPARDGAAAAGARDAESG
jgi:predicted amidophosphoribosyltransferase